MNRVDRDRRHWCAGGLAGAALLLCGAGARGQAKERVIKITAKKFEYAPREIALRAGEAVVLEFTAIDFTHGFKIPDLGQRADLVPGQVTRLRLRVDKAGVYDFLCDNFCGSGHENMNGKLIVAA